MPRLYPSTYSGRSIRQFSHLRIGQPEAGNKSAKIDGQADYGGGVRQLGRRPGSGNMIRELRGDERRRRAQHPAADVGGEALTSAAQMRGIDAWQVVSPEAELRHREESA